MGRKCINYSEFQLILADLKHETTVTIDGNCIDEKGKIKKHFYFAEFKNFRNYPMFIGRVHDMYGRDIEIETMYGKDENIMMYIRGYGKELK